MEEVALENLESWVKDESDNLSPVEFKKDVWKEFRANFQQWQQDDQESSSGEYEFDEHLSITMTRVLRWIAQGGIESLDKHVRFKGMNPPSWYLDQIQEKASSELSKSTESEEEYAKLNENNPGGFAVEQIAKRLWAEMVLNDATDDQQRGVGHLAHNYQIMRFLLEICRTKQEFLTTVDNNGDTPLHVACQKGDDDVVHLLLYNNETYGNETPLCFEDVDIHAKNKNGNLPLHEACASGKNVELVEVLIKELLRYLKRDNNNNDNGTFFLNKELQSPFDVACESGHIEVVQAFLNNEEYMAYELWLEKHKKDVPTLHRVAKKDGKPYSEVIELLVAKNFNIDQKDEQDDTALHHAARAGMLFNVDLLLELGANPREKNDNGERPIHVACQKGFGKMVGNLYHYDKRSLSYLKDDKNVIEMACEMKHLSVIEALLGCVPVSSTTVEYGWDVFLRRNLDSNQSPLQIAAAKGYDNLRRNLDSNQSPLQIAAAKEYDKITSAIWKEIFANKDSEFGDSDYILKALMQARKKDIEKILENFKDKRCCGFLNLQAFFNNELKVFKEKIEKGSEFSDFDGVDGVTESSDQVALLAQDNTEPAYYQSLEMLYVHMTDDFDSASLEEKIDRINIIFRISEMMDVIDDPNKKSSEKKAKVQDTFDQIKPFCRNQLIWDNVKVVLILAAALVAGAAIGLGAAWVAATVVTSVSSVCAAVACTVVSALVVNNLFKSHTHKRMRQLSQDSLQQAERLGGLTETESSISKD